MFAIFVVVPLGTFLLAWLIVSGEHSVKWLWTEISETPLFAGLIVGAVAWALVEKKESQGT